MKRAIIAVLLCFFAGSILKAQTTGPSEFYVVTAVTAQGFESVFSNQTVAAFGQGQHIATLSWTASTSTVVGYNVYRATVSGGPYVKVNTSLVTGVTYTDTFVLPNAPTGTTVVVS